MSASPRLPKQPPALSAPSEVTAAETAAAERVTPTFLVLMVFPGSGKSTVALELHRVLGWPFQEGDDLHPPDNVEKMRSGRPLNDQDPTRPLHLDEECAGLGSCPQRRQSP